jgi:uncharacterized MAPEG superfamily protein
MRAILARDSLGRMTTPLWCLIGFAGWTIALVLGVGTVRVARVLLGKQAANSFPSGTQHGGDRYWRANRAHLNATENLPIFGAIVVTGHLVGMRAGAFAVAAIVVIAARVAQTVIHISSNANMAVNCRFTAYLTQLGAFAFMIADIASSR